MVRDGRFFIFFGVKVFKLFTKVVIFSGFCK